MNHKILWTLSLLTICIIVIIWTVCNFAGVDLPDMAVRIMGIIDLCAIPVLIYSTLKMRKEEHPHDKRHKGRNKNSHKEYHEYVETLYKKYDVNKVRDLLKVCTKEEAENITRMQLAL